MSNYEEGAWRRFANQIGAQFSHEGFLLWRHPQVVATANHWRIRFYTETVSTGGGTYTSSGTVTRIRAPYVSEHSFRFHVYREGLFSRWGKALKIIRDIEAGDPEFDREFIIKGSDESKVRALFANKQIRQLIRTQPRIDFKLHRYELCFDEGQVITDTKRLKSLYELFAETLNKLREIDVAH